MTVNAVSLTKHGIALAADSRVTFLDDQNIRRPSLEGRVKIVQVPNFVGAMALFGVVRVRDWDALTWLNEKAQEAAGLQRSEVDNFAEQLAQEMGAEIHNRTPFFAEPYGIGVHFAFYDLVDGIEIPELIFITNFQSITNLGGYQTGTPVIQSHRQSFHTVTGNKDINFGAHSQPAFRKAVYDYVRLIEDLPYQNGDNALFNLSAGTTEVAVASLLLRKALNVDDALRLTGKKLLLRTELVAKTQEIFCVANHHFVGGPCHNLMISPDGQFFSDTGLVVAT